MAYPDAVNLPFNGDSIKNIFQRGLPEDIDTGELGYWVILQEGSLVVMEDERKLTLPSGKLPEWLTTGKPPLRIGSWHGKPLRALRVSRDVEFEPPFFAEPFNAVEERLNDSLLTIGGLAHQILHWERQSSYCPRCGESTIQIAGTWGKQCTACRIEHYPHIHPCVIVLVRRNAEFLLTRKSVWPQGRYSLVAGFVDFGESLEECVHREVKEETGIEVTNVRYVGSQNWPFPSQLMAGFVADYAGGEIVVDRSELEDAKWFSSHALPGSLPTKRSIARWIIDNYGLTQ